MSQYLMSQENQPFLLTEAQDLTGTASWRKDAVAFGILKSRETGEAPQILAIGVFENFNAGEADFSFAMVRGHRMNRGVISGFLTVAFHHRGLNLRRLWMMAPESNIVSQRSMLAIGATFQFRKRAGAATGEDAIVMLLERPDGRPMPAARAPQDENEEG